MRHIRHDKLLGSRRQLGAAQGAHLLHSELAHLLNARSVKHVGAGTQGMVQADVSVSGSGQKTHSSPSINALEATSQQFSYATACVSGLDCGGVRSALATQNFLWLTFQWAR
jgi:hypothetical protein